MSNRFLILNADDYGMCYAANEAVEHIFREGTLSTTTLMTCCPWAEDAVRRAKENPAMRVGLHITLTSEWRDYRWGPVSAAPVDSLRDAGGYFPRTVETLLAQAKAEDVAREMDAQLAYMLSRGLRPTHIDNHMGSVYGLNGPSFMPQVLALCAREKWAFRLPRSTEAFGSVPETVGAQLAQLVSAADSMGIGTIDQLTSHHLPVQTSDGYAAVRDEYMRLIRECRPGITEIYLHPAKDTEELRAICPDWQKRVWEYQFLMDPCLPALLEEEGIALTNWVDAPFAVRG